MVGTRVGVTYVAPARSRLTVLRSRVLLLPLCLLAACGGRSGADTIKVDVPSPEPERIAIQTLQPPPPPTATPSPTPTPVPTPTPPPVAPPRSATIRSAAGTQAGDVGSYCWSEQVGGPSQCFTNDPPAQDTTLAVRPNEKVLLRIDVAIAPDDESIRPFQGSRSGYPDQQIDPALETELTIDLPQGTWSMDLCAAWHGRGQPICWLFKLKVG